MIWIKAYLGKPNFQTPINCRKIHQTQPHQQAHLKAVGLIDQRRRMPGRTLPLSSIEKRKPRRTLSISSVRNGSAPIIKDTAEFAATGKFHIVLSPSTFIAVRE